MNGLRQPLFLAHCWIRPAAVLLWWGAASALAAPAEVGPEADAQNPSAISTFELEAGAVFGARDGKRVDSWYRLQYRGKMVKEQGTPFKAASPQALLEPKGDGQAAGDASLWSLKLDQGSAKLGGGFIEAAGRQEVALRGLENLKLRGAGHVSGGSDGKQVQLALGLETAPFRLPGASEVGATNWLIVGVNAQRQGATDTVAAKNQAVVNYRAFLGKAFGWHKSADVGKTAAKLEADMLSLAPSTLEMESLFLKLDAIDPGKRSVLQQLMLDTLMEFKPGSDWPATVRAMARGHADAITDQPTWSLIAESSGFVVASGPYVGNRRFKNLFSLTADYWLLPSRDDVFLRLRYENGFEWAQPQVRRNLVMTQVVLRF